MFCLFLYLKGGFGMVIWVSNVRLLDCTVPCGGDSVFVCCYGLVCVWCVSVHVVEALY